MKSPRLRAPAGRVWDDANDAELKPKSGNPNSTSAGNIPAQRKASTLMLLARYPRNNF